jgi:hypothetical protein
MIDDQTGRKYPVLPPIAPAGKEYLPSTTLRSLLPGQAEVLTIQFAIPPPPPSDDSQKQTASFLFPNAKGSMAKVLIPLTEPTNPSAGQSR